MEKIIFVANISKPASEIFNSLSRKYETKMLEFNKEILLAKILEFQPSLIVVYSKELSHGDAQVFHALISNPDTKKFPVLFIGNENDYRDYVTPWDGNIAGIVLTPVMLSTVMDKINLIFEAFHQKNNSDENSLAQKSEAEKDERRHILIVDDDSVMLRTMVNILKDSYKTTVAKSGTAAISLLGTQKPDLILLDYLMPVCDGLQTLQMIRSEENTKDIPVFFLTGVSDVENVKNAMALKPEGYILKTTKPEEILKRIGDFFAKLQ
ncbi:MAG: response regulator [Treponema sp.]|nr:response regulator [Treponema sp.]